MNDLVIAEKPELARNIARAVYGAKGNVKLPWRCGEAVVCACAGHLVGLAEPDQVDPDRWGKPWREESLPVLPEPWPKKVSRGKEGLVANIRRAMEGADRVIHAGDPDDEGQLIVDELLDLLGWEGPVMRVLVNDNIDANIRRAFERMDDNAGHAAAGRAAEARQLADFCFGASESRLATLRAGGGRLLSVGRVQTPTLGLVVRRDEEIAGHVSTTYYTVCVHGAYGEGTVKFSLEPEKRWLDGDGRLTDKAAAGRLAAMLEGARACGETRVERKRAAAPLPYNLTELTADMSRRHKMGAQRVMDATQSLRDRHRAITYNRSDCQYLPREAFGYAEKTLGRAMCNIGKSWALDFSRMPRCFDDSKIDAHTGIIPQDIKVDVGALAADERKVYEAIVERYAMQFAGDEEFETSVTETAAEGAGRLVHKARRQIVAGWRGVCDDGRAQKGFDEGWVEAGEREWAFTGATAEEKKTKPRPPYTEGTLVRDMARAAKYVRDPALADVLKRKDEGKPGEHGGIGTTATRAKTIETLKSRGYVKEERGHIVSTRLGREFYRLCPPEIADVDTTARWWLIQERVAAGEEDVYAVARDVCRVFRETEAGAFKGAALGAAQGEEVGRCPLCGAAVVDRGASSKKVSCSSNRWRKGEDGQWRLEAGCGFSLWKTCLGKRLTRAQLKALCEKGRTGTVRGFTGRSGKSFDAVLVLEDAKTGKVGLEFRDKGAGKRRSRHE